MIQEPVGSERNPAPAGGPWARLVGIFYAPKRVFSAVDRGSRWWEPWIWASVLYALTSYLAVPIQARILRINPGPLSAEDVDRAIERMQSLAGLVAGLLMAPVMMLVIAAVFAGASYLVLAALTERASFQKHLTLCLWSSIVWSAGALASALVVRAGGIEEIRSARDAMASFGPAVFFPEAGAVWFAVLSSFDLFALWFYLLVAVGAMHIFRLSGRAALLAVAPIWLINVVIGLLGAAAGR